MDKFIEYIKKPYVILLLIIVLAIIIVSLLPARKPSIFRRSNFDKIESISKLATIETYYHNVATKEEEANGLGKLFFNMGYKKIWIEYEGTVKFGIDAKKVKIGKPNSNGVVKVYVPKAEIIGEPNIIKNKLGDPITDTGFLTSVSPKEKTDAIAYAQEKMVETAEQDTQTKILAEQRARELIKNYIIETGKGLGEEYTVEFISDDKFDSIFT